MSRDNITNKGGGTNNPHKFKVGDKVRRTGCSWEGIIKGEVYTVSEVFSFGSIKVAEVNTLGAADCDYFELTLPEEIPKFSHKHGLCEEIPLTSSPIECILVKARPESKTSDFEYKPNLNFLNQQEESNMSNKVNRRVLNIQLLDNDAGLPVEHSLVAEFNGVVTEDSNEITLQEIISTGEVAKHIEAHNKVRAEQVDQTILQNTGQTVKLRPVKLKDLTWNIK